VSAVEVTTRGGPFPAVSGATLRRRAEKMLAHLGLDAVELSIALVDDPTIRELNRTYRGKDKPTDVLAFPLQEPPPKRSRRPASRPSWAGVARPTLDAPAGPLGDVILSIPTAGRQAKIHRRPLLAELTMLLAHGLLHLLGFDHQTDAEEAEMTARTRELEAVAATRTSTQPKAIGKRRR
jgi:probable rRNA maturation factor